MPRTTGTLTTSIFTFLHYQLFIIKATNIHGIFSMHRYYWSTTVHWHDYEKHHLSLSNRFWFDHVIIVTHIAICHIHFYMPSIYYVI